MPEPHNARTGKKLAARLGIYVILALFIALAIVLFTMTTKDRRSGSAERVHTEVQH